MEVSLHRLSIMTLKARLALHSCAFFSCNGEKVGFLKLLCCGYSWTIHILWLSSMPLLIWIFDSVFTRLSLSLFFVTQHHANCIYSLKRYSCAPCCSCPFFHHTCTTSFSSYIFPSLATKKTLVCYNILNRQLSFCLSVCLYYSVWQRQYISGFCH